jgi:predicted RNA-binding protein with PIN domain
MPGVATVLVDGENVRRSVWPNISRDELAQLCEAWGDAHGHRLVIVWEGDETADDRIAQQVRELAPPIWVVTSDRELRERVGDAAERILGGGSFARELQAQRP